MISLENLTDANLTAVSHSLQLNNIAVLERMLHAFILLDRLTETGLDFIFKGGTSVLLHISNPKRLSVDIDLDFTQNIGREEMLNVRESLKTTLQKYMSANGYYLSPKSKFSHALDSFVFTYTNCGGVKDNIKVEINYSLRAHILPVEQVETIILGRAVGRCSRWF